jgi:hypothetical protein
MARLTKNLGLLGSIALLALAAGCKTEKLPTSDAPDGLYIKSDGSVLSYTMKMLPPGGGKPQSIDIQEYKGFVPQHVTVIPEQRGCFVQITGAGTGNWLDQVIVLVANKTPYLPARKSAAKPAVEGKNPASPATIFLVVGTVAEAEKIAEAMRTHYYLPPEAH